MLTIKQRIVSLYVDRASRQWIVRDADGDFWLIPVSEEAWKQRRPFTPSESTDLEPVPGHYKSMLGLPF